MREIEIDDIIDYIQSAVEAWSEGLFVSAHKTARNTTAPLSLPHPSPQCPT